MTFNLSYISSACLKHLRPFKNILYFLFLFFLFEFFWKLFVHQGDDGSTILVGSYDLTSFITPLCLFTAKVCYWFIHDLFGYKNFNIHDQLIYFDNSIVLHIVWGCTGLKQILQFVFIILLFFGRIKNKVIFIPVSVLILFLFNICRLILTAFVVKDGFPDWFIVFNSVFNDKKWDDTPTSYWIFYQDWYHFFHDHIFKWVYYDAVVFILWLLWVEKFSKRKKKRDN